MLYVSKLVICFFIFSFLGWCLEVVYSFIESKKFVNRGFLIGPMCPIYGLGCVLIYIFLKDYSSDPIVLMVMAMILCSVLEYFASYILEKIFNVRWWDYNNMKFNINGRICLEMSIPFGILGLIVVDVLLPFVLKILTFLSPTLIYTLTIILMILFIIDIIFSLNVIIKFKNSAVKISKDSTQEIKVFFKNNYTKNFKQLKRLIDSFPNWKLGTLNDLKDKVIKKRKN